jgi:predicted DNA-binding transcriptional regulator AlpA
MQIQESSSGASTVHSPALVLSLQEVRARIGLSKSTIRWLELRGAFPRRRVLAPWRRGWPASEIDLWVQTRRAAPLHD